MIFSEKLFDLEFLNKRIASYNLGSLDKANRPSPLKLELLNKKKVKIKQKAARIKCLL